MNPSTAYRSPRAVLASGLALAALLFAGCPSSLFEAKPDLTRFYLLSAPPAPSGVAANSSPLPARAATIGLGRVELPAYLRSPAVILRPGGTEVRAAPEVRWAEPLDQGIARVLRETLQSQPGVRSVVAYPAPNAAAPAYEITVRVLACEGVVEATGAQARFAASWEIRATTAAPENALVAAGTFEATPGAWTDGDYGALTGRLGEAVAALARELAAALPQ